MPQHGDSEKRERSDFFSVEEAKRSIPKITAVPETKEEIRRRRVRRVSIAVASTISALLLIWLAVYLLHRREIDQARLEVERTGRADAIDDALSALDGETGPGDVALAARIHATAELAGITGHRAPAEQLLASHDPAADGASDHRIAQTYLALAQGDPTAAAQHASALVARGPRAAEAGYARALVALAIGNVPQALAAAQGSAQEMDRQDAPRVRALLGLVSARSGAPTAIDGDAVPLRLARARVRWDAGEQRDQVGGEVAPIAEEASATPAERAWAQLLTGLSAIDAGDTETATRAIEAAAGAPPPGDELFRVQLAEAWLALGRRTEAQAIADALSPGISTDAGRRAQLASELHLASGRLDQAESALSGAPAGPRTSLLRARIADARGQVAPARALYEEAARSPAERVAASVGLAAMLVRTGAAQDAIALVDPLLEQRATHPRIAATAAGAHAGAGDRARGLAIAQRALEAHPREPLLLAAKARVHLASGEWQPALDALRTATEVAPRDPALQAERGRAAMELGQLDEARRAYETSIEVEPAQPEVLRALLSIQLQQRDLEAAGATVARIDAANVTSLEIEQLRARWLVDTLAGAEGLTALRRARRTSRRDLALAHSQGRLYMQAERWFEAIEAFQDALPESGATERRDVFLWRALALARARRETMVEQLAEQLREGAAEAPMTRVEEARLLTAEAWLAFMDETIPRASVYGRRALDLDPTNADALVLMGAIEDQQRRDGTARYRRAMEAASPSIEAYGRLALIGEMNAERCGFGRRYLRAAPDGGIATAVRERVATCPAQ
ncbi:tetratricopeptide repeat protein [Sandaracinus amylolyticus]|uniref:tetratricopeptide repeat protein n=1 Tax=Sandaracinus amylolyticus TaxID=927083 RepID=UPI001F31340F|nr:tetratricopeptide repeat protein [Sandaracinus amylolyticus]UJR82391.1 Hypothetical protein I5071_44560 [Sandaracinus amylolyticus]